MDAVNSSIGIIKLLSCIMWKETLKLNFFFFSVSYFKTQVKVYIGFVWIPLITENWKHYSKIIFKFVNNAMKPSFKVAFTKRILAGLMNSAWDPQKNARNSWKIIPALSKRSLGVYLDQWRRQNFSLEGAKLKDDIKSEINLKNINQQ